MAAEWKEMTIGEFCPFSYGKGLPKKNRQEGPYCVFGSNGVVGFHKEPLVEEEGVIIGRKGTVGAVHFSTSPFWPIDTTFYIKKSRGKDIRFIYYMLKTLRLEDMNSDSAVPGLNRDTAHTRKIMVPPFKEQQAIACILGALDDKIELNRRMNETLEAMARALFKSWFVDFDPVHAKARGQHPPGLTPHIAALFPDSLNGNGLPDGWEIRPLSEFFSILGGGTPKTKEPAYWGGDILWYSVADAPSSSDVYVHDTEKTITELGVKESSAKIVREGTTIISARGTIGKLAMAAQKMTFNQSCYGLQGVDGIGDCFTYLAAKNMVSQLQAIAHGSVFSTITRATFQSLKLAKPDTPIFYAFEQITKPLFDKIKANGRETYILAALRDTLLPKLISGELRVPDAERIVARYA